MNIRKIDQCNFGTFQNFIWDTSKTNDFSAINFLVGWNGTGKTIISQLFSALSDESIELPDDVSFKFSTDQGDSLTTINSLGGNQVRVFNDKYLSDILSKESLDHLVFIGKDAVDYSQQEKRVRDLHKSRILPVDRHTEIAKRTSLKIKTLEGIGNVNRDLGSGHYRNYDKAAFERRIDWFKAKIKAQEEDIQSFYYQSENDLAEALQQLKAHASRSDEIVILQQASNWVQENIDSINSLITLDVKSQSSDRIEKLAGDIQNWIEAGIDHHSLRDGDNIEECLFCRNAIENVDELTRHFSDDDRRVKTELTPLLHCTENLISQVSALKGAFDGAKDRIHGSLRVIQEHVNSRLDITTSLGRTASVELTDLLIELDDGQIKEIASKVENTLVHRELEKYGDRKSEHVKASKALIELDKEIAEVQGEITKLKAQAKNIQHFADKLNHLLEVVFPTKAITLRDSQDHLGYELSRNGQPTTFFKLSEGERNFIGLVYFLLSLKNEAEKLADEGIVVIDDPVSSLDRGVIFQIFSLIAEEISQFPNRQYFVLTHNLDFFGLLLDEFRKKRDRGEIGLYHIKYSQSGSSIENIDKVLENYNSDYQYCLSKLWENQQCDTIENALQLVNPMRRAWETFLTFKFHKGKNSDLRSFIDKAYIEASKIYTGDNIPPDQRKTAEDFTRNAREMYRFVNYGSHQFLGIDVIDDSILQHAGRLISDFFEVIRLIDPYHHKKISDLNS